MAYTNSPLVSYTKLSPNHQLDFEKLLPHNRAVAVLIKKQPHRRYGRFYLMYPKGIVIKRFLLTRRFGRAKGIIFIAKLFKHARIRLFKPAFTPRQGAAKMRYGAAELIKRFQLFCVPVNINNGYAH